MNVVKCQCGSHYNADKYPTECPYCHIKTGMISDNTDINSQPSDFRNDQLQKTEILDVNYPGMPIENEDNNSERVASFPEWQPITPHPEAGVESVKNIEENDDGFINELEKMKKTVGKYISPDTGESTMPVVGWIVCVKGAYFGQSFQVRKGRNRIGRTSEMDIRLLNDDSVSRECVATIVFDGKSGSYSITAGEGNSLAYVNDEVLLDKKDLHGWEKIELGDSGKNRFIFIPLCDDRFSWGDYEEEEKK